MAKIEIVLDAAKLRNLVTSREYTNKSGEVVKVQEVKFELVEVKEKKTVASGDWGFKEKTHFCAVIQTKEERDSKVPTIFIGDGFTTHFNNVKKEATKKVEDKPF